jgi:hypothetical protein
MLAHPYGRGVVRVAVTGMSAPSITLRQKPAGGVVGVIGSWNLVRFDDFVFNAQNGPTWRGPSRDCS